MCNYATTMCYYAYTKLFTTMCTIAIAYTTIGIGIPYTIFVTTMCVSVVM